MELLESRKIIRMIGIYFNFLTNFFKKGRFDTIMLFSVFHHTKDLIVNGKKIAQACNRIIIECRLGERGGRPDLENGKWSSTSVWRYETKKDLYNGLENYSPSFEFYENYGLVDKSRYIILYKQFTLS